jgi:hypothetical protein
LVKEILLTKMPSHDVSVLSGAILGLLRRTGSVLFAGAGVACRVGFPNWKQYMHLLADACEDFYDPASATLVRQRTDDLDFLGAATVFKSCRRIPEGERLKRLAAPFQVEVPTRMLDRLDALVQLPFSAIVTTNYDTAVHRVRTSRKGYFTPLERGDGSLRGASLQREFFLARIHGRAELPASMVVDSHDYESVMKDNDYSDFLFHLLRNRPCLFLGFSFADPAISHVLRLYEDRCGPHFDALHLALVPSGSENLEAHLARVNVQTIVYDADDDHSIIWRAIRHAFESHTTVSRSTVAISFTASSAVHKYMAFAYAQMMAVELREPVIGSIRDGMVLKVIADGAGVGVTESEVVSAVRESLALSRDEAAAIVSEAIARLRLRDQIVLLSSRWKAVNYEEGGLDVELSILADAVLARMRVRDSTRAHSRARSIIKKIIEGAFVARAWDLAAHFAGAGAGVSSDIAGIVSDLIQKEDPGMRIGSHVSAKLALVDLLTAPEDRETKSLTRIGRAAFGLQLVMSSPRQTLFQKYALPQRLYLDANVAMPAITNGHPLRPIYVDCLRRLAAANNATGQRLDIFVAHQFLNEIVSHRRRALEIVKELGLEDPVRLRRHILFYEAMNTNVFVGAYASRVGRTKNLISFSNFIHEVAPYEDEAGLATCLRQYGIQALDIRYVDTFNAEYNEILGKLKEGYGAALRPRMWTKPNVLIEHEAAQLTRLMADTEEGVRSIFVTADGELRRILQRDARLHQISGGTMSHLGLVALVDVMVGIDGDSRSLSRLIWATPQRDAETVVFDYFVRIGLRSYREGMAMEMQEAARAVATAAAAEVTETGLHLFGNDLDDIARTAKFIDRYEEKFFDSWSREIAKKEEREERNS